MGRTAPTLGLLTLALPLNLALTGAALLRSLLVPPEREQAAEPRTILLSGGKMTKALQLARSFHAAGHRVILVEAEKYRLTGHRFSRAVDRFYTVPVPEDPGYAAALAEIVRREGVDVYVPVSSPVASLHDADAAAALDCEVLHVGPAEVRALDDKHAFAAAATKLGLPVPDTHRITDPQQVADFDFAAHPGTYLLKSIPYDPVRRLDLTQLPLETPGATEAYARSLPISEGTPFILQSFVSGQEYCTHATARDGAVQVHCCCESSASQLNYAGVGHPGIEDWVRRFVGGHGLTGQISLDFIETADGELFAIECNPRTHSAITMFHDHPGLAAAYLEDGTPEVRPLPGSRPTHWLYHEVWKLVTQPGRRARARSILRGKDAIFAWDDPLPFLLVHHLQIPALLLANARARRGWVKIDFNIGKLVEPDGD